MKALLVLLETTEALFLYVSNALSVLAVYWNCCPKYLSVINNIQ